MTKRQHYDAQTMRKNERKIIGLESDEKKYINYYYSNRANSTQTRLIYLLSQISSSQLNSNQLARI
jgi:hypothetical protein